MQELNELKNLVIQSLEAGGCLSNIRAQIRSSVFKVIDQDQKENKQSNFAWENCKTNDISKTEYGFLLLQLIRETFAYLKMDYTQNIYVAESNIKEHVKRADLVKQNLKEEAQKPLLLTIFEQYAKQNNVKPLTPPPVQQVTQNSTQQNAPQAQAAMPQIPQQQQRSQKDEGMVQKQIQEDPNVQEWVQQHAQKKAKEDEEKKRKEKEADKKRQEQQQKEKEEDMRQQQEQEKQEKERLKKQQELKEQQELLKKQEEIMQKEAIRQQKKQEEQMKQEALKQQQLEEEQQQQFMMQQQMQQQQGGNSSHQNSQQQQYDDQDMNEYQGQTQVQDITVVTDDLQEFDYYESIEEMQQEGQDDENIQFQ